MMDLVYMMDIANMKFFEWSKRNGIFQISENFDLFQRVLLNSNYFWTGVLDLSFGKMFGKFCKCFLDVQNPCFFGNVLPSKDWES